MDPAAYISLPIVSAQSVKHRFENALGVWYLMQSLVRQSNVSAPSSKQHSGIFGQEEFRGVVEEMTGGTTERNVRRIVSRGQDVGLWQKIPARNGGAYRVRMCGNADVIWRWMRPLESTGHRFLSGLQLRPKEELIGSQLKRRQAFVRHCAERPVDHGRSQRLIGEECGITRETVCRLLKDSRKVANYVLVSPVQRGQQWERDELHRQALNEQISYSRRSRRPSWIVEWKGSGKIHVGVVTQTVNTYLPTGKPIERPTWTRRVGLAWETTGNRYPINDLARKRRSRLGDGLPAPLNEESHTLMAGELARDDSGLPTGVIHIPKDAQAVWIGFGSIYHT